MTYAIHRNLLQRPANAVRGDGVYVIDADGNRYLDGCGGAAVSCLGHNNPNVIDAIRSQAEALPYAHTSFFSSDAMEMLAEKLVTSAPGMGKVLLLSGGSEAIEAALSSTSAPTPSPNPTRYNSGCTKASSTCECQILR